MLSGQRLGHDQLVPKTLSVRIQKRRKEMYELGMKDEISGAKDFEPLRIFGRPARLPLLQEDEVVICGYDQGAGERMIVCENLQDMQKVYDAYARGGALSIHWYRGEVPKVKFLDIGSDEGLAGQIINQFAPDAPEEVKKALAAYAKGNPGAARVLSQRAKDFTSAKQVEDLVGWPLGEHSFERTDEIWDRFRD